MATNTTPPAVADLLGRSNRLGSDPRNTNYAGGNASAKETVIDPVTQQPTELLWVKGSGGDLGTLTAAGLAALRLDRLRALVDVYPGVDREDEMVDAFDYCLHGKGGAAPSIDTAMHGLVDATHVDHLHPDAGIAVATAADGEALTKAIFGDRVVWVPWRGPGSSSAWTSPRSSETTRRPSGSSWAGTASPPGATPVSNAKQTRWRSSAPHRRIWTSTASPSRSGRSSLATSRCPKRSGELGPQRSRR
jgi:Class II Aldolase and Adducin N-terminal domain